VSEVRRSDGLAYEVTGSGPAVLLIHAGIANRAMWDPQWETWGEQFTLIRYDQRGFGESADPAGAYFLHEDALRVLDAAGVERAAVIGASIGGRAALDLAIARPQRVAALVAVATTPSGWAHTPELDSLFDAVESAYESGGVDAANELELRIWVDGPRRDPSDVEPRLRELVGRMNRDALAREEARERAGTNHEPTELQPPALDRLGDVVLPTLVVTGALDQPSVNAGAAAIADAVRGASSAVVAGASHLPSLERPTAFEAIVAEFLAAA
jgi:pimeloyl-ACP methyl ester carboxylesterase